MEVLGFGKKFEMISYLPKYPQATQCDNEDLQPNSPVLPPHGKKFTEKKEDKRNHKFQVMAYKRQEK